jgi:hypothetical protein
MRTLRAWIAMSWIMLPGVMVGGSLLLRRLTIGDVDPFEAMWIRAFHAHGGVLIMMSILYYMFLDGTTLSARIKHVSSLTLFVGIGALVSGFLLHALRGQPGQESLGTVANFSGAGLITVALGVLVYGLIRAQRLTADDRG